MSSSDYPLSKEEFDSIYSRVPRLTVEAVVKNESGEVYLTKRSIEPCKGQWHLPGGTVFFGELLVDAVKRVAARELGIAVRASTQVGYIEYPSHFLHGMDSPVGIVFEVTEYDGEFVLNGESQEGGWFATLPDNTHADQDDYLVANNYLRP